MNPAQSRSAVAHLLRRAAFGGHADEIDALTAGGYEAAVEAVCDTDSVDVAAEALSPPPFDTASYLNALGGDADTRRAARMAARQERRGLIVWWLRRMAQADHPAREKATLLWHDHFATSVEKVKLAELMYVQRQTLHDLGHGSFDVLVAAMVRDPAMLVWLDGRESTARAPNENFARELFELFTLGHGAGGHDGHAAGQPYTETDVADAARAFTGWRLGRDATTSVFQPGRHDAGPKSVLGVTGALDADDVVALATSHPACAPHVVARLWSRVARPATVEDPVVVELAAGFAADLDIAALRRRIYSHPEFLASRSTLLKTPIEYVVGAARALRVSLDERVVPALAALGQLPFVPPDVAGWPANEGWLSTSSALTRLQVAVAMAAQADLGAAEDAAPVARPAALARLLGLNAWGEVSAAAIAAASDTRTALVVALVAPEYLMA